jgi:hypothetical protein
LNDAAISRRTLTRVYRAGIGRREMASLIIFFPTTGPWFWHEFCFMVCHQVTGWLSRFSRQYYAALGSLEIVHFIDFCGLPWANGYATLAGTK